MLLRRVPKLNITGIEVTQAIQSFGDPNAPDNSMPLVAHKNTIVRVYVKVENLGGFALRNGPDEVSVSGELIINGSLPTLPPLNLDNPISGTTRLHAQALRAKELARLSNSWWARVRYCINSSTCVDHR